MEVTGAIWMAFDAINLSNLFMFTVEEASLALHAELNWLYFVLSSLI